VKNIDSDKITSKIPTPSMNSEVLIALVKLFRKLEADQKDLDFRRAQWARDARTHFPDDKRFILWCQADLGITYAAAQDLCLSARAAVIVPDAKMWNKVGGARSIKAVLDLPKREQIDTIQSAVARGIGVRSVYNERHPAAREPSVVKGLPTRTPAQKTRDTDVTILAKFIAENHHKLGKLPSAIDVIVRMYAPRTAPHANGHAEA
jgi:hypothetical protein